MSLDEEIVEMLTPICKEGLLSIERDQSALIQVLSRNFKFSGSKIDWSKTANHWHRIFGSNDGSRTLDEKYRSVNGILREKNFAKTLECERQILYVNDSSLEFGLRISHLRFWESLEILVSNVPQHHYFFAADGSWCLAITMEGFVDFAYAAR